MTNRELLGFYKTCKGRDLLRRPLNGYRLDNCVLDSSISIKEICELLDRLDEYKTIKALNQIFHKNISDKRKEELLKMLCGIIKSLKYYFNDYVKLAFIENTLEKLERMSDYFEELKFLDVGMVTYIYNGIYKEEKKEISIYDELFDIKDSSCDGVDCIKLIGDIHIIDKIGAIIFKDKQSKVMRFENKSEFEDIDKLVWKFDYELVIASKNIMEKRH